MNIQLPTILRLFGQRFIMKSYTCLCWQKPSTNVVVQLHWRTLLHLVRNVWTLHILYHWMQISSQWLFIIMVCGIHLPVSYKDHSATAWNTGDNFQYFVKTPRELSVIARIQIWKQVSNFSILWWVLQGPVILCGYFNIKVYDPYNNTAVHFTELSCWSLLIGHWLEDRSLAQSIVSDSNGKYFKYYSILSSVLNTFVVFCTCI